MTNTAISMMGHNQPPSDEAILEQRLRDNNAAVLSRAEELAAAADRIPAELDDEEARKATDFISQINSCAKALDKVRTDEKEPFLKGGRIVDAFFKRFSSPLEIAKAKAQKPLNTYTQKKREEERKAREEEEERRRKEAEERLAAARLLEGAGMDRQAEAALQSAIASEQQADRLEKSLQAGTGLGVTRAASGAVASIRKVWTAEITDRQQIDLEMLRPYFSQDHLQAALNAAMRAGITEIRGARIYQREETVVR